MKGRKKKVAVVKNNEEEEDETLGIEMKLIRGKTNSEFQLNTKEGAPELRNYEEKFCPICNLLVWLTDEASPSDDSHHLNCWQRKDDFKCGARETMNRSPPPLLEEMNLYLSPKEYFLEGIFPNSSDMKKQILSFPVDNMKELEIGLGKSLSFVFIFHFFLLLTSYNLLKFG